MKFLAFLIRLDKLSQTMISKRLSKALFRHRVLAGVEHRHILRADLATIVDIGANKGQFSLAARQWATNSHITAFEPLPDPAGIFRNVFADDASVVLQESAIGPDVGKFEMHISARDDSSSLLPISSRQGEIFPGTAEVSTIKVAVAPLENFISAADLVSPALLKIDVQGFELKTLQGCASLLGSFQYVYVECSFVELYEGQALAPEVIGYMRQHGFKLTGIYNTHYDKLGLSIQGDFMFARSDG